MAQIFIQRSDISDITGTVGGYGIGSWKHVGNSLEAVTNGQFSTNGTGNPNTVTTLKMYWLGEHNTGSATFMGSDLQIGDRLFFSCPNSTVISGDPSTLCYRIGPTAPSETAGQVTIPVVFESANGSVFETSLSYGVTHVRTSATPGTTINVEKDNTPVTNTPHGTINFTGAGVTATDAGGGQVNVTIAPGAAPIDTVFGRTGTVVAVAGDYTATQVTNTPAGSIAATTVQAAINELDTEKADTTHTQAYTTVDGVPAPSLLGRQAGTGTGASVALTPTQARTLLNVADGATAAGATGDAYATSHEADGTAHDSDEIVYDPSAAPGLVATNVKAALDELDGDKAAVGHTHTLTDVTDSGTAAALDADNTIGNIPVLQNIGGNPGFAALDGSNLTSVSADANISVVDLDTGPTTLTTNVQKFEFTGAGVTVSEPVADEIRLTITGGAGSAIDITDGTTTVSASDKLTVDATAFTIVDQGNNDALLNPDFGTGAGQIAQGNHTHDTLANVAQDVIVGRVSAGSGVSEELNATQVRTLLNVENNAAADQNAAEVPYSNATSGMTATDTQAAIDEVEGRVDTLEGAGNTTDVTLTGTPNYITITGQVITRNKLDLPDDLNSFTLADLNAVTALSDATLADIEQDTVANIPAAAKQDRLFVATDRGEMYRDTGTAMELMSGVKNMKKSCRAATTVDVGAIASTTALENNDTIDGVTLATGDRVLVKNQTTASENGVYIVAATGAPSRATDLKTGMPAAGTSLFVEEGTANGGKLYLCTSTAGSDTVGTHSLTWGLGGGAEENDLTSAVTWANVPDANITQSSVTQHEGAINHDNLTGFAANEHRAIDIGTDAAKASSAANRFYVSNDLYKMYFDTGSALEEVGVPAKNSIEIDTDGQVHLVGDAAAPGNTKVYGTNGSGVKGWYDQSVSETNNLATQGIAGIADDQLAVGTGAGTAAYQTLANGAVAYNTTTGAFAQANFADLGTATHTHADAANGGQLGTTALSDDAVTNAKLADMGANTIKGNNTASTAVAQDIAVGANTVLGRAGGNIVAQQVVNGQITDTTIVASTKLSATGTKDATTALRGNDTFATTPTVSSGAGAPASTPGAIGDVYVDTTNDNSYIAADTTGSGDWKQATGTAGSSLGGLSDVTLTSPATDAILIKTAGDWVDGTINTASITDDAVSNAKLGNMAANTVKVNATAGSANPTDLALGASQFAGRKATGNIVAINLPTLSKSITIEDPTATENISMWFTTVAITVQEMHAVLQGSATPSCTWRLAHATTRNSGTPNYAHAAKATTSVSSVDTVTPTGDNTIPANSFVWMTTTAQSGTVDELSVTIEYTED